MSRMMLDFWVGLFVLIGLLALVFLALKVGNLTNFQQSDGYKVTASFENIGSLKERAPVKSAGVVVGRVSNIHFDNQTFEASVTLELDPRFKFPRDSSVAVLTTGLLGEQYIGIEPGGDSELLKDGSVIKLAQSALVWEQLVGQMIFERSKENSAEPQALEGAGGRP